MTNRIDDIEITNHSLVPAEADVRLSVVPERVVPGLEVRGRLMGPRCRFAGTVEVAYHLRPVAGQSLTMRAIIPEASLWDPECPHLYHGPVELWQDGQRLDSRSITHGLRSFTFGPRGLRINGQHVPLRGREVDRIDEAEALSLRQEGVNLLVAPVRKDTRAVWTIADQVGFVVLGRVEAGTSETWWRELATHASCLGWIIAPGGPEHGAIVLGSDPNSRQSSGAILLHGDEPAPSEGIVIGRLG